MPKLNLQNVLFLGAAKPGSGSGGQIDYSRVVEKTTEMPTASELNYKTLYMYVGETDANYTHGYIYECQKTSITYTGTVSFEAATLSGTTVTCDGDDFATFLTEAGADPTPIVSGTMTYDAGAGGWRLVGKDAADETVTSFLEYTEDYTDHGFVFTGTPEDGDVIAFTCTVEEDTVLYAWVRLDVQPNAVTSVNGSTGAVTVQPTLVSGTNIKTINNTSLLGSGNITTEAIQVSTMPTASADNLGKIVQFTGTTDANYTNGYFYKCTAAGEPAVYSWTQTSVQPAQSGLPDQTGNSGKFLTTNGTDASWGNALTNDATIDTALIIKGVPSSSTKESVAIGVNSKAGWYATSIGYNANTVFDDSVGIGYAVVSKYHGVAIGSRASVNTASTNSGGIAIGYKAATTGDYAIQLGHAEIIGYTNSDANTFKVGNNNGNFEMMSADGTIPADRLASTSGLADGNYRLRLTMASGVPTLTWVAE